METERSHLIIRNHTPKHMPSDFMADVIDYCREKAYMPGTIGNDLAQIFFDNPVTDIECVQYFIDELNTTVDQGYYSLDSSYNFVATYPTLDEA